MTTLRKLPCTTTKAIIVNGRIHSLCPGDQRTDPWRKRKCWRNVWVSLVKPWHNLKGEQNEEGRRLPTLV